MKKVAVMCLTSEKDSLLTQLMDFGAMEVRSRSDMPSDEIWTRNTSTDEDSKVISEYDESVGKAKSAIEILNKYGKIKEPLFITKMKVKEDGVHLLRSKRGQTHRDVEHILGLNEQLLKLREETNKLEQDRAYLIPWRKYGLPLEKTETKTARILLGTIPVDKSLEQLVAVAKEPDKEFFISVAESRKDYHYIGAIIKSDALESTMEVLKDYGFTAMSFSDYLGTADENLQRIFDEQKRIEKEIEATVEKISAFSKAKEEIEVYADFLTIDRDKEKVRENLLKTKKVCFIQGWIPAVTEEKLKRILEERGCYYFIEEPAEEDQVPVLIENKSMFVPFEGITEMYSLPDYRGFDPTSIFAAFYAIFFGIMLSDAGYGILMAVACGVILKKYELEGSAYKMIKLFLYCGLSTAFWGAMFGGWFGDIIQVFSRVILNHEVVIKPIWFNPIDDPMKLLIFSLALGVLHLFVGMGIKSYMQIREGKWLDAFFDQGFWYILLTGAIIWAAAGSIYPPMADIGKYMFIGGAVGLLLTGGRHNKGFGKVVGGLAALYNITGYLSDILSYSRLLALGLATGVIAQVINTMGGLFGGGIVGGILLMVVFIFGHSLNFAINALGSYVHSCRLQYIEFFGKFYEDGGEPFKPFKENTKYIKILKEK